MIKRGKDKVTFSCNKVSQMSLILTPLEEISKPKVKVNGKTIELDLELVKSNGSSDILTFDKGKITKIQYFKLVDMKSRVRIPNEIILPDLDEGIPIVGLGNKVSYPRYPGEYSIENNRLTYMSRLPQIKFYYKSDNREIINVGEENLKTIKGPNEIEVLGYNIEVLYDDITAPIIEPDMSYLQFDELDVEEIMSMLTESDEK